MKIFFSLALVVVVMVMVALYLFPERTVEPITGVYDEGLTIAYDKKESIVSGYYENYMGWNEKLKMPKFSCIFYLKGITNSEGDINIKTWYPGDLDPTDVINGTLKISKDLKELSIRLQREHGGCWNVQHFTEKSFVSFNLARETKWLGFRFVKADKAYFYRQPDIDTKKSAYVLQGDVVKIIKNNRTWLYVEYKNVFSSKVTQGWMKVSEMFSTKVPK